MSYDVDVCLTVPVGVGDAAEGHFDRAVAIFLAEAEYSAYAETAIMQAMTWVGNDPRRYLMWGPRGHMFTWPGGLDYFVDRGEDMPVLEVQAAAEVVRCLVREGVMIAWQRALLVFQAEDAQVATVVRLGVKVDADDAALPDLPVGVRIAKLPFGWGGPEETDMGPDDMTLA